jgi:hypothetical protein
MALTVPLLLLCLVSPPGTHTVAAIVVPRAGLVGLPGSEQGVLSGHIDALPTQFALVEYARQLNRSWCVSVYGR